MPFILLNNNGGYLGEWAIENNFLASGGFITYLGLKGGDGDETKGPILSKPTGSLAVPRLK